MAKVSAKRRKRKVRQAPIVARFAEKLRELRTSRGMSQAVLAARAHVSVPYIGRLERGETAPGIDLLDRLAQALEAGTADLLPTAAGDPEPLLRDQIAQRMAALMARADRETLLMLAPWLAMLDDAAARRR